MFKWFKAKPVESKKEWGVLVDGNNNYYVRKVFAFANERHFLAQSYFKDRKFGNVLQCENAIIEWEKQYELNKKKHVKYI